MSAWIKLVAAYRTHPKTLRLRKLLGPGGQWYPVALWLYCADSCPSGGVGDDLVEEACGWTGKPGRLLEALKATGFIDGGGVAHGWEEWSGSALSAIDDRRRRDRERVARRRRDVRTTSERHPQPVRAMSPPQKEKEKEKEIENKKEQPGPAAAGPIPPSTDRTWRGLGKTGTVVMRFLDRCLRKRDETLALPEKLGEDQTCAVNKLLVDQDPNRVRLAIKWAFEDDFWRDKISDGFGLIANYRKIINASADAWTSLKGDVRFLDA